MVIGRQHFQGVCLNPDPLFLYTHLNKNLKLFYYKFVAKDQFWEKNQKLYIKNVK